VSPKVADPFGHAWHLYVIQVDEARFGIGRDEFIEQMVQRRIGISVHFIPLHIQPYYRDRYGFAPSDYPNALAAYQRIVSLPIYARMTDADIDDVIEAVLEVAGVHQR